jgi:preprotein translocase subunit SecD
VTARRNSTLRSAAHRSAVRQLAALIAAAVLALAACGPQASQPPNPTISADHSYSICPVAGELPAKEITDDAVRIITERLQLLGVPDAEVTAGAACIAVAVALTSQDADAVQAAVLGTGDVSLVPVAPDLAPSIQPGGAPPDGAEPLIGPDDFTDASTAEDSPGPGPTLTLMLSDAGGAALGSWTTTHVRESLALVVDGVVIAVPIVNEPITGGSVVIAFPAGDQPRVPPDAIRAMVVTGPLPPEWAQPERPQG